MITGGDLRQSRLDVGYKTFTISPWIRSTQFKNVSKSGESKLKLERASRNLALFQLRVGA